MLNSIGDPFSIPRCLFVTTVIKKFKMILDGIILIAKQNPIHWLRDIKKSMLNIVCLKGGVAKLHNYFES